MCVSLNIQYSKISGSSMFINVSLKISLLVGGFNHSEQYEFVIVRQWEG